MIQFFDSSQSVFLNGMDRIQAREQQAQTQLTTGLKINTVSDDPSQLPVLMQVRSSIAENQQITSNLSRVKSESDSAESALSNATSLMDNITSLGSEGEPTATSAATRNQLAQQVGDDLQQMVTIANTQVEGRYVFSGDDDQTQPYTIDLTQTNPVSAYAGSPSTRTVQLPDGSLLPVSETAQQIFDSTDPTTNVFSAISNLRTALLNNDQTGIDSAISSLNNSSTYLNTQLAFYGNVQSRVNGAIDFGANLETQLETQQSQIQDADLTQSITELSQASTQQQAALAAENEIPKTSLFDYLG